LDETELHLINLQQKTIRQKNRVGALSTDSIFFDEKNVSSISPFATYFARRKWQEMVRTA